MKKKIIYFFCLSAFLIIILLAWIENYFVTSQIDLSALQVYEISRQEAYRWNQNSQLLKLISVDTQNSSNNYLGNNGKRVSWNAIFGDPEKSEVIVVTVRDGKIINRLTGNQLVDKQEIISPDEIKVDSYELIIKAQDMFKLKPGRNWAKGYHYNIFKSNGITFFSVVGLNDEDKLTKIYFQANNGQYLGQEIN